MTLAFSGDNTFLTYRVQGRNRRSSQMRCSRLSTDYSQVSEESHARQYRALYPHLRIQGTFALTFDFIHYTEFNAGMDWFRDYFYALLNALDPSPMLVSVDARDFLRLGIPVKGPAFGDHTASMTFSPTITFISVADPRDPKNSVYAGDSSSAVLPRSNPVAAQWFYPGSTLNNPGALQRYLYDQAQEAAAVKAAAVQEQIYGMGGKTRAI